MKKEIYRLLEAYMHSCMGDSAHDREHVYRVLFNALEIAQDESGVDYDVLITACLLHDVGRQEQFANPEVCHAQAGSEKVYDFLIEKGFTPAFASRVQHCIRTHRFRRNDPPETLEAKILFDADKLDVAGAIGIARTLLYKGDQVEPLYTRLPNGQISNGEDEESSSFFREYKFKLEKLYDRFLTQKGAKLARQRQQAAAAFYTALYREVTAADDSLLDEHLI